MNDVALASAAFVGSHFALSHIWLAASRAHIPLAGWAAGIWRWI